MCAAYSAREKTWVEWFCTDYPQGPLFVQIDQSFLRDSFNFYGLRPYITNFKYAVEMIRSTYSESRKVKDWPPDIEKNAIMLYGLLHARYLLTASALKEMYQKYQKEQKA